MLKYKSEAKRLYSIFFTYRNDIDLYVEDEEKDKEFYKVLFTRLMEGSNIKINDVTPLGSRNIVIQTCIDDTTTGRKKLYIIDGDIYIINESNPKGIKNLFVLDGYCIENFIIDQRGALEILHNCIATQPVEKLAMILNFDKWLGYNVNVLIDLFIHYSIAQEYSLGINFKTAHHFTKNDHKETVLDVYKVEQYVEDIMSRILEKITLEEYDKILELRRKTWNYNNENLLKIVSGKDFILPLLQFRIKKVSQVCKSKSSSALFPRETIKMLLIKHCDLKRLEALKRTIEAL